MHDSILKEDHVHASAPDALVVMAQEGVEALLQTLKWLHWLVHLGWIKVWPLRFFPCGKGEQTVVNRHLQSWPSRSNIWLMSTCGLGRVSQEVDKVSVSAEVHHALVLVAHLFTHKRGQGLVKPLHVLQLGESVGDDALALMLPQRQQQLRKKILSCLLGQM